MHKQITDKRQAYQWWVARKIGKGGKGEREKGGKGEKGKGEEEQKVQTF